MTSIAALQKEIDELKARNRRVEADKAWETSWTRRLLVLALTYIVIVLFFSIARIAEPFVNALVPSIAFLLSTMTVPIVKRWWFNAHHKK